MNRTMIPAFHEFMEGKKNPDIVLLDDITDELGESANPNEVSEFLWYRFRTTPEVRDPNNPDYDEWCYFLYKVLAVAKREKEVESWDPYPTVISDWVSVSVQWAYKDMVNSDFIYD